MIVLQSLQRCAGSGAEKLKFGKVGQCYRAVAHSVCEMCRGFLARGGPRAAKVWDWALEQAITNSKSLEGWEAEQLSLRTTWCGKAGLAICQPVGIL